MNNDTAQSKAGMPCSNFHFRSVNYPGMDWHSRTPTIGTLALLCLGFPKCCSGLTGYLPRQSDQHFLPPYTFKYNCVLQRNYWSKRADRFISFKTCDSRVVIVVTKQNHRATVFTIFSSEDMGDKLRDYTGFPSLCLMKTGCDDS